MSSAASSDLLSRIAGHWDPHLLYQVVSHIAEKNNEVYKYDPTVAATMKSEVQA